MATRERLQSGKLALFLLMILNGVTVLVLTVLLFEPYWVGRSAGEDRPEEEKVRLPAYDYTLWHALPVQTGGRVMPFETACIDVVRQVTGRAKFEKLDPVAVVLSWIMYHPGSASASGGMPDWDNYPFILCDHHELRQQMFSAEDLLKGTKQEPTNQQLHGKYVTPTQVRNSKTLRKHTVESMKKRAEDPEKGHHHRTPLESKTDEVMQRLSTFEAIVPAESVPVQPGRMRDPENADPFRFAVLDKVHGGAWLSLGFLRACSESRKGWFAYWASGMQDREAITNPEAWQTLMRNNLGRMPHLYLDPETVKDLRVFQEQVRAKTEKSAMAVLHKQLDEQSARQLARLTALEQAGDHERTVRFLEIIIPEKATRDRLHKAAQEQEKDKTPFLKTIEGILHERNRDAIGNLQKQIEQARATGRYYPEDERFRDLHMTYLELRFPDLYRKSAGWQPFPTDEGLAVLSAFDGVQTAYRSGNVEQFGKASQSFADTIQTVSKKFEPTYPIATTIDLEMQYNRVEPFRWAWVSMLVTVLMLSLYLGTGFRWLGIGALVPLAVSMGFQGFAYYARWLISGRPPVTNMYETVVFVATMSVVFALILELVYRRGYILLAGAVVGTIGLVLADQLPTGSGFDSRISPLTPVLRSNFWLLIHVLTIVASYAAGTLAWGLGNLMLGMYLVGSRKHDQLKMMANFCYKAMQIAVLLLAAGTFLGGWWAAESWGRFWGFDPKENFALLALIVYVIPLHMRYMGWVKDFGMAVSAVLCYAAIFMSWYGVNFILPAGLHSYGAGSGGNMWAFWAGTLNLEFLFVVWYVHTQRQLRTLPVAETASV